ncbi:pyridoxamine 5'-phosphate oxidase family protein [Thalassomonas viridans]|uniref:Pyridoxamine 5'-phosphate oxidase family protein n=1 Tax=Thalassomonas viridans TaxID=137584 RepID=A0AAE9Z8P5_9GAMM|nr:pyridoxamine 5'-phosphate oxidase family protein [Thalassomonas viridans]WDE08800.1 pyridoxamine 5'-phosphate oxidase family protein [Thalassomonas viridans]
MLFTADIRNEQDLRKIIPAYHQRMDKRIQTRLDHYCLEYLDHATLACIAFAHPPLGFYYVALNENTLLSVTPQVLNICLSARPCQQTFSNEQLTRLLAECNTCSLYFFISGIGHGLRINAFAEQNNQTNADENTQAITFNVLSAYFQCSRAAVRAGLWEPVQTADIQKKSFASTSTTTLTDDAIAMIASAPYLLLLSQNEQQATELSPRGGQAGFVKVRNNHTLLIPEWPGNKVAISLRNILKQKLVSLSFIVPGCDFTLAVQGEASLISDRRVLSSMAIKSKAPLLAIAVSVKRVIIQQEASLNNALLWQADKHKDAGQLSSFSKVMAEHLNGKGLLGKVSRPIVGSVIRHDLKNLY